MPRWSELVCDLKLGLVMCDLDRERRSQARPSGLVSGQAWREGVAPCSVVRAALYVIRDPRSSGRDPGAVARGSRIGDLLSSSMAGVRDPWCAIRELARVGLDARSIGLDPWLGVRDPRAVARGSCSFLLVLVRIL